MALGVGNAMLLLSLLLLLVLFRNGRVCPFVLKNLAIYPSTWVAICFYLSANHVLLLWFCFVPVVFGLELGYIAGLLGHFAFSKGVLGRFRRQCGFHQLLLIMRPSRFVGWNKKI
jgi:hypothetical protein